MKDLIKFLAGVVLASAAWGVWTHQRAEAPVHALQPWEQDYSVPAGPRAGVVWDKTPRAEAPTQKRLFDDVLKPTPGSLPRTAWEIQLDAIVSPKTQAGRDRLKALEVDPDWRTLMVDWKLKNPTESAKIDADWKEGMRFLGALKVAVDGSPQASTMSIYWVVDCLVLDKGATTNGCDDNPYERAEHSARTAPVAQAAEIEQFNANLKAQRAADDQAKATATAVADEIARRRRLGLTY